jgi:hypothetical protein
MHSYLHLAVFAACALQRFTCVRFTLQPLYVATENLRNDLRLGGPMQADFLLFICCGLTMYSIIYQLFLDDPIIG